MTKINMKSKTYSVKQYSKNSGIPLSTVYHYIHTNKLPEGVKALRVGSVHVIQIEEIKQRA